MLTLRLALPALPMTAALSASHLVAVLHPPVLRRLYIARDADRASDRVLAALAERAEAAGIEALALSPQTADFNDPMDAVGADRHMGELGADGIDGHPARTTIDPKVGKRSS